VCGARRGVSGGPAGRPELAGMRREAWRGVRITPAGPSGCARTRDVPGGPAGDWLRPRSSDRSRRHEPDLHADRGPVRPAEVRRRCVERVGVCRPARADVPRTRGHAGWLDHGAESARGLPRHVHPLPTAGTGPDRCPASTDGIPARSRPRTIAGAGPDGWKRAGNLVSNRSDRWPPGLPRRVGPGPRVPGPARFCRCGVRTSCRGSAAAVPVHRR
jgi:hypothetical protein